MRSMCAIVAGFVLWWAVATLLNFGLRATIPGYSTAEPTLNFTLGMKFARLLVGALSSVAAGAATALIAPTKKSLPWMLGAIVLAMFIPIHVQLWSKFPVWYHFSCLGTLMPLVATGATLARCRSREIT